MRLFELGDKTVECHVATTMLYRLVGFLSSLGCIDRWVMFTQSSKRPALHLLEVCWTSAGSCSLNTPLVGGACCTSRL